MTDQALTELPPSRRAASSSPPPRTSTPLGKLRAVMSDGLRFMGMVVLGMLGVWALVLLFG